MTHPTRLRFRQAEKTLRVEFASGETYDIPYEALRVESPSAEVQGHGGVKPPPPVGKENVGVVRAEPIGHYAVRIVFDDGHNSGYYTWPKLLELGQMSARA